MPGLGAGEKAVMTIHRFFPCLFVCLFFLHGPLAQSPHNVSNGVAVEVPLPTQAQ